VGKLFLSGEGNTHVVIRDDLKMSRLMSARPASRWNPEFWFEKYELNEKTLFTCGFDLGKIGDYEKRLTYGAIVTGKEDFSGEDYYLINQGDISFTGIDLNDAKRVRKNSPWVLERAIPKANSLILARSGMGGIGKNRITILAAPLKAVVDSFVDLLDVEAERINPYYVLAFWKSQFGWLQVERFINGVGTVNISFDEIREVQIPILADSVQSNIEAEYRKMLVYHDKAMQAKKRGIAEEHSTNIRIAEQMLRELIKKTEAVIRGEHKDVV
jgi:hypothetical protein